MNLITKTKVDRQDIVEMQNFIENQSGSVNVKTHPDFFPMEHTFADGIYVRKIFIPAGFFVVGKIHKYSHPNFLLSGTVKLITEFESKELTGPLSIISEAGTKRTLYSVTDLTWVTCHANPNNIKDINELVNLITAESYEEFELFIESKKERIS